MSTIAAPSLITTGTPNDPTRVVYCISRPRSSAQRLTTAAQEGLDRTLAPEFSAALDTAGIQRQGVRKTYRCGSAEVPAASWTDNDLTPDDSILQPRRWLADVVEGVTDVLVLDGLYAVSCNPAIMLQVTAAIADRGGLILVMNMDGSVSVYAAHAMHAALEQLSRWLEEGIDWHGPGGKERGDDPDHFCETVSLVSATTILTAAE